MPCECVCCSVLQCVLQLLKLQALEVRSSNTLQLQHTTTHTLSGHAMYSAWKSATAVPNCFLSCAWARAASNAPRASPTIWCNCVCCSVLQCVAVCVAVCTRATAASNDPRASPIIWWKCVGCSVLQGVLQCVREQEQRQTLLMPALPSVVAVYCGELQCVVVCCNVLQCVAVCFLVPSDESVRVVVCCSVL